MCTVLDLTFHNPWEKGIGQGRVGWHGTFVESYWIPHLRQENVAGV